MDHHYENEESEGSGHFAQSMPTTTVGPSGSGLLTLRYDNGILQSDGARGETKIRETAGVVIRDGTDVESQVGRFHHGAQQTPHATSVSATMAPNVGHTENHFGRNRYAEYRDVETRRQRGFCHVEDLPGRNYLSTLAPRDTSCSDDRVYREPNAAGSAIHEHLSVQLQKTVGLDNVSTMMKRSDVPGNRREDVMSNPNLSNEDVAVSQMDLCKLIEMTMKRVMSERGVLEPNDSKPHKKFVQLDEEVAICNKTQSPCRQSTPVLDDMATCRSKDNHHVTAIDSTQRNAVDNVVWTKRREHDDSKQRAPELLSKNLLKKRMGELQVLLADTEATERGGNANTQNSIMPNHYYSESPEQGHQNRSRTSREIQRKRRDSSSSSSSRMLS